MISIIVPVYNVEKYLSRCIESIINQTYTDLEIILVDDGSPDGSGKICDDYAALDSRIKVIHKENGGVSSARNCGIDNSTGEYLTFIDSDDYIEPEMFECIANAISQKDVDIVFIREKSVNLQGVTIGINGSTPSGDTNFYEQDFAAGIIIGQQCNGMCDKTYRKSLVGDLRVLEGKTHGEDLYFNIQFLKKIKVVAYIDKILYSYVTNEDSITHQSYNAHTLDGLFFKDASEEVIRDSFPKYFHLAQRRSFVARLTVIRLLYDGKLLKTQKDVTEQVENYLKEKYKSVKQYLSFKEKTEYILYSKIRVLYPFFLWLVSLKNKINSRKK